MKKSSSFAAVVVVLLIVAGVFYWAVRARPPSVSQDNPIMGSPAPPQGSVPTTPAETATPPSSSAAGANQATGPTAPNEPSNASSPQRGQAPGQFASPPAAPPNETSAQPSQATSPAPDITAGGATMPSEDKMSLADRRQVQEALHRLGYYDGPRDGIFGPLTRAAIRRFQESITDKITGRLTAAEASRLVSGG